MKDLSPSKTNQVSSKAPDEHSSEMIESPALRFQRRRTCWIVGIITAIGIFYFSTIRQDDGWADFAMYLHHAKNIVTGVPYAETGYIYNPHYSSLGPPVYPPIAPLLLSFVYAVFPGNLTALRVEMISAFLLSLWIIYLNFRKILPWKYLVAALLCIGLNPQFWEYKDKILSEVPFLLFTYLGLFFIHRSYLKPSTRWWESLIAGVLLYLAYGTRSIGLTLVSSFIIFDFLQNRRISLFAASAVVIFLLFAGLQMIFLTGTAYKDRLSSISAFNIISAILTYAKYGAYFWDNAYSKTALHIVSATIFVLSGMGFISRIRTQVTIYEIFAVLLSAAILLYPGQHHRYLFPLIPLCIVYAFLGFEKLFVQKRSGYKKFAFGILLFMIFASYAAKYTTFQYSSPPEGVHKKESIELFRYVKQNTGEDDVMIFRRPRALALYTGRKASVYHQTKPRDPQELWEYFQRIHATHIIESYFDVEYFRRFVAANRDKLEKVYSNSDFTVYQIQ